MATIVPITVGIPTYARGQCVLNPLERILACDPVPAEVIVHVDASDGELEKQISAQFPTVRLISSINRIGPGGGRDRCLRAANHPYFASFDDDSWPVDADFFARVMRHFEREATAGCLAAVMHHRNQPCPDLVEKAERTSSFTGCGEAMRVDAYLAGEGYIDRSVPYGIEELDVAMQFHAAGWKILECQDLRVFHDTVLAHHVRAEITAGTVENAALLTWLRYPVVLWFYGFLQYVNVIRFMITQLRFSGLLQGILGTPLVIWRHRHLRRPLSVRAVVSYLLSRTRPSEPLALATCAANEN